MDLRTAIYNRENLKREADMRKIAFWLFLLCISDGNTSDFSVYSADIIHKNQQLEMKQIDTVLKEIEEKIKPKIKLSLESLEKKSENQKLSPYEICQKLAFEKEKLLDCVEKCLTPVTYTILSNPQEIHQQFISNQKIFQLYKVSLADLIRNIYVDFFSDNYHLKDLVPVDLQRLKLEFYKIELLSTYIDYLVVNIGFYQKNLKEEMTEKK